MAATLASAIAAAAAIIALLLLLRAGAAMQRLRILAEQGLAGARAEAETTRATIQALQASLQTALAREQGELRLALAQAQRSEADGTRSLLETKLADIQRSVNEQLHAAVERQMTDSFARVIDQFAAVQKAMGDVAAVTAQIGDIKRLFSNVATRGGWGEAQLRGQLDDILPPGSYEANCRVRPDTDEVVEFAVRMPVRGGVAPLLAIDAKFPVEDYERLLDAAERGDTDGERAARKGLERRMREEARRIASKYIAPPVTVEFAVLYVPTDSLFAEIARIPGLIDDIGRTCRVMVLGPSLLPALLRTIHLGIVGLALEQRADQVRELLGATKREMVTMDDLLAKLLKNAGAMANTIEAARRRTRAVRRVLRDVETVEAARAEEVLEIAAEGEEDG